MTLTCFLLTFATVATTWVALMCFYQMGYNAGWKDGRDSQ